MKMDELALNECISAGLGTTYIAKRCMPVDFIHGLDEHSREGICTAGLP